ncbi:SEL1-like repeat protein [Akkermansiaceae bacterium]|nr:SEL1-like repeat protein [Akkermansiaceae bacterium]
MKIIIQSILLLSTGLATAAITVTQDFGAELTRLSNNQRQEYFKKSEGPTPTGKTPFEKAFRLVQEGNHADAAAGFKKLSDSGDPDATCALASLHILGLGVDQSTEAARALFEKAADRNHPVAMLELAMLVEKEDPQEAFRLYQRAGTAGQSLANLKLGHCYETAGLGAPKNPKLAFSFYEKSANAGVGVAKGELARCYDSGLGTSPDPERATKLYREAGLNGVVGAQLAMAERYFAGQGVEENRVEAVRWLTGASQNGSADAQVLLGDCFAKGDAVDQDYGRAGSYYSAAAKQGDPVGRQRLAGLYRDGKGTSKDPIRAYVILSQAKGHPLVDKDLKDIVDSFTREQLKIAQAKFTELEVEKKSGEK